MTLAGRVTLRPLTPADEPLAFAVYASTREEELAPVPWSREQKEAFLRFQFHAQSTDYRLNYPDAQVDVILMDGEPVGRLYVDRRPDEIRIIDIAVLTAARGRGAGTFLLQNLCEEARRMKQPVTIHVEKNNPALRLYQRLGFRQVEELDLHFLMRWRGEDSPHA